MNETDLQIHALHLPLENGGVLTIREDAVMMVKAGTRGGRNLACEVNGMKTLAGYDFVLAKLGWACHEVP